MPAPDFNNDGPLFAPFPYFGGKRRVADAVWRALGKPKHYIEPFFGSGAVLLLRPDWDAQTHIETVCDVDGHLANVWRSLQFAPDETARWCDWPVNHADLAARRRTLIRNEESLLKHLIEDENWYDPLMAGYWIWAASCWIGSGLISPETLGVAGGQIPHLTHGGLGVHALSGVKSAGGKRPHLTTSGLGVHALSGVKSAGGSLPVNGPYKTSLYAWFRRLSERMRYVRVVCGDWSRVCGGDWQDRQGTVGMFFDPPYSFDVGRCTTLYASESADVAKKVAQWACERGEKDSYRIVLAGFTGEHDWMVDYGWRLHQGVGGGCGYGRQGHRECLWMSPHCIEEQRLF